MLQSILYVVSVVSKATAIPTNLHNVILQRTNFCISAIVIM